VADVAAPIHMAQQTLFGHASTAAATKRVKSAKKIWTIVMKILNKKGLKNS